MIRLIAVLGMFLAATVASIAEERVAAFAKIGETTHFLLQDTKERTLSDSKSPR
jgi:hypothetical protein